MIRRFLGGAMVVAGVTLAVAQPADAFCGFYVSGADAKLFNNATQVVMMREGTRTVLSMQNNYQGPPADFAMVVPVPVVLQKENVKTLPRELFSKIDQLDAPRLVEYWEQDPCAPIHHYDLRGGMAGGGAPKPAAAAKGRDELGVTVEAQFTVGEYEVVILSAKDAGGLDTWLKQEKYKIPEGSEALFRPYVQAGSKFFVARVDVKKVKFDDKGMATLSPLRFHYDSEQFNLPVRLGLVNSNGTQDLIVHILAKGTRYEVANYPNATIPTNFDVAENARDKFGSFYASLFDRTLEKNPKAVVTEYSWDASTCDPCPGPALSFNDLATLGADVLNPSSPSANSSTPAPPPVPGVPGSPPGKPTIYRGPRMSGMPSGFVITRLHARYSKDSLGEDLIFKAASAIVGGREIRPMPKPADPTAADPNAKKPTTETQTPPEERELEHGATASSTNNFQGRYAIRHPWGGPITCKEPKRGHWGGPPSGRPPPTGGTSPKAATNLAFVARDEKLPAFLRSEIAELGIKAEGLPVSAAVPLNVGDGGASSTTSSSNADSGVDGGTGTPAPKSGCGCVSAPIDPSSAAGTSALVGLAALALRRKRRGPSNRTE